MTIATWQPGEIYIPGALVLPTVVPGASATEIPNADFESGDSDWTKGTGWAINTNLAFAGTYSAEFTGASAASIISSTKHAVSPGKAITASCFVHQGAAADGVASAAVTLTWYTSGDVVISTSTGNVVSTGAVGVWFKSTLSATAPPTAAKVSIGCEADSDGTALNVDGFAWNYVTGAAATGLAYKAVQAEAGTSGAQEPDWPTVVGNTVVDNEVTWEAVTTGSVTWEASSVLTSGSTEPTWPTQTGAYVSDNNIAWETVPLRITDENCPHSKVVAIAASKVFAGDTDVVRFCATLNARDWSSTDDAGFLPTGLQQKSQVGVEAMGVYRGNLAVWSGSTFQVWQVDPDPAAMALLDAMEGVGSMHHQAVQPVADDLFFVAALGVRTVSIAAGTNNLATGDAGKPIDVLIKPEADAADVEPIATYYPGAGQYWLAFRPRTEEGQVVPEPEPEPDPNPPEYSDYDICIMMDNNDTKMIYFGVDFTTGEDVDIASFHGQYGSATDGTLTYIDGFVGGDRYAALLAFRGHCFSYADYQTMPGNTPVWQSHIRTYQPRFISVGTEASSHGFRVHRFDESTQLFTSYFGVTETSDYFAAAIDLKYSGRGEPGYGDALVLLPRNGNQMATYFVDPETDVFSPVDRQTCSALEPGAGEGWGWNRNTGLIGVHFSSSAFVDIYSVNLDTLAITEIGRCDTTNAVYAVCFSDDGHVVTLENGPGDLEKIRTYSREGLVLTQLDEWELPAAGSANTNQACQIQISPYTNRFWCMTQNATLGTHAFEISALGIINVLYSTDKSINNTGSIGNPIIFVDTAMNVTGNGFAGIKAKLYEAWEMSEASGTRAGAMGNVDLPVTVGSVGSRVVGGVTGADFDGASSLSVSTTTEQASVGSFAVCVDVELDTIASDMVFTGIALSDENALSERSWRIGYSTSANRFFGQIVVGSTAYTVNSDSLGAPSTGTLYHLYFEYNLEDLEIRLKVNNGTANTLAIPSHKNPYQNTFRVGQASTAIGYRNYFNGGMRRLFYFWEPLSVTQQEWMYNSGNTRAFSEL